MEFEVEYTDEFAKWWETLDESTQDDVSVSVELLIRFGPALDFPHSSAVKGSRYSKLRELRVQSKGSPFRIFYYFNGQRIALLLHGGRKSDNKWYRKNIRIAEKLIDEAENELNKEGKDNG